MRDYRQKRKRYYLKNSARFTAVVLTLLVLAAAVFLIGGEFHPVRAIVSMFEPTPSSTATPEPSSKPEPSSEATPSPEDTPTPTPSPANDNTNNVIVVIDPGHGGRDPGTVSPYKEGFYEKDITLDLGLKLRDKLQQAGIQVVMTREEDKELDTYWKEDVWARPRKANEVKATFFVSIHVNSSDITKSGGDTYNGTEVYHYGKTHGQFTSKQFAEMMGEEIDAVTDTKYNGVVKEDLGVLRLSEMPALLVETAYITNKEDHKRLESDSFRKDMVDGIFNGTIRILEAMGAYKEDGVYRIPKAN